MPLGNWNLEFLNHNAQRNYPLADDANGTDISGSFVIPPDFIVELDLPIHAAMTMEPGRFFVKNIGAFPTGYSIIVAYDDPAGVVEVATALISLSGHTRNKVYTLGGIEPFDDTMGKVVIGRLDTIAAQPAGLWEFSLNNTMIEPDSIRPIIRGVQSITIVDGTERSVPLYGDIELIAGTNIQLVPIIADGQPPKIRINAITGEGLIQQCVCEGEEAASPCIKTFNGVAPTADGKFNFVGDACIDIVSTANGLKLVNKCSTPCCDCTELTAITRDLERFNEQRSTFEQFLTQLQTSVNQMDLVVLGARLGDRSCISCE